MRETLMSEEGDLPMVHVNVSHLGLADNLWPLG